MVSGARCFVVLRALQCSAVTQSEKRVWPHAPGPRVTDKLRALWKRFISQGFCCSLVFSVVSHPKDSYSESLSWFQSTGRDPRSEKHVTESLSLSEMLSWCFIAASERLVCCALWGRVSVYHRLAEDSLRLCLSLSSAVCHRALPLRVFSVSLRCGRRTHSWYLIHHMMQNIFSVFTVFRDHQLFLNFKTF